MTEGKLIPGSEEVKAYAEGAMQRHHDYFVGLERMGELSDEDRSSFDLAMQREREGQVQPLSVEPSPQPGE